MPEDVRKDLDMDGVARRNFMIASATAVGTSAALVLGTNPANAQGGATPPASSLARTTYTGDVINGKRVVTALDVNDLEPDRKHLLYFRDVAMPTGQHWHVSVARAFLEVAPVLAAGCVLLRMTVPETADSIALLQELRAWRIGLPVVAVDGSPGDAALAVQIMRAGAVDYVAANDSGPGLLLAAIAAALAAVRDAADATTP